MILIKTILFFMTLIGFGLLIQNTTQTPGFVVFDWYGYEVETSALFIVICLFALTIFFFIWGRLWSLFMAAPKLLAIKRDKKREKKGFETFFKGMDALASGNAKEANKLALKTSRLLGDKRLPHMIRAEAAQMLGNEREAVYHFTALSENKNSSFLGLRGLLSQSYKAKNYETAYSYAKKAYKLKPKSSWVLRIYFEILVHLQKFEEALVFLSKLDKNAVLNIKESNTQRAFINYQLAKNHLNKQDYNKSIKYIDSGLKSLPSFIELGELKISIYQQQNKTAKVIKSLEELWKNAPNKNTFNSWISATSSKKNQLRQAQNITKKYLETAEGCIALGLVYKTKKQWQKAEQQFENALKYTQNQYIYNQLLFCTQQQDLKPETQQKWQNKAMHSRSYSWELEDYKSEYKKWCETYLNNQNIGKIT